MRTNLNPALSRRRFVLGASNAAAGLGLLPLATQAAGSIERPRSGSQTLSELPGPRFELAINTQAVNFTGRPRTATTVNGSLPGPTMRWREGDEVEIHVHNHLAVDTSVHWHGMLLPANMDGVPGLSFDGIKPGQTFIYRFKAMQSGTYWYHSHSDFQEQTGLYGAIIVDPRDPDPVQADRDYVVMLSDWSDENPHALYHTLKRESHYYNRRRRTLSDFFRDVKEKGWRRTQDERAMWNHMRMSATDIADITGYAYTYLMNGNTPETGWLGLFKPGEKIRLRIINAAAMTLFDVRIPGLKMTVVAADGQNIQPVVVDEFRIGVAETYDVIVEPQTAGAYTVFAQTMDRSGFTWGTLTSDAALRAPIPAMDPAPVLSHRDMGMGDHSEHGSNGASGHAHADASAAAPDHKHAKHAGHESTGHAQHKAHAEHQPHEQHGNAHSHHQDHTQHHQPSRHEHASRRGEHPAHHGAAGHHHSQHQHHDHSTHQHHAEQHDHSQHQDHAPHQHHAEQHDHSQHQDHAQHQQTSGLGLAGFGSNAPIVHAKTEYGPQVDMRAESPRSGLDDPGIGLRDHQQQLGRRVLNYRDLRSLAPTADKRQPSREIQLHLTGNMERYMWSMDGVNFDEAPAIQLALGERVRFLLVNDTMMVHPIHLHGFWSELETGDPEFIPRKHTVLVQPGATVSYLVTADTEGPWAYHCHLLYHMAGMMRVVHVGETSHTHGEHNGMEAEHHGH